MAKPISFGEFQFRTKRSATEECQRRINEYGQGKKLNSEDEFFFSSLFTLHSEYFDKKGVGIDYITVELDFNNNRCLYIHRIDGSKIECSWRHCLQPASTKQVVSMSFRRAVKERIMAFKKEQLNIVTTCPILGLSLSYKNSHASYVEPTFDDLLSKFLSEKSISYEDVSLTNPVPDDEDQRGIISNSELVKEWNDFHKQFASLQLISAKANRRKLKS